MRWGLAGQLALALAVGVAMAWAVAAASIQAQGTVPTGAATNAADTSTTPPETTTRTTTVTEPAQTVTETQTKTTTISSPTTNHTTSVQINPLTSGTTSGDSGSDVPAWGWVLIGLAAIAVLIGVFALGHGHGAKNAQSPAGGAPGGQPARYPPPGGGDTWDASPPNEPRGGRGP